MGLLPDSVSGTRRSAPLAVRVVVLARARSGAAWKPIWQADVIAQAEEVVDLAAESVRDGSLRLWMHVLPDGAIAVDADLALKGAACLQSSFSGIQQTGVPSGSSTRKPGTPNTRFTRPSRRCKQARACDPPFQKKKEEFSTEKWGTKRWEKRRLAKGRWEKGK